MRFNANQSKVLHRIIESEKEIAVQDHQPSYLQKLNGMDSKALSLLQLWELEDGIGLELSSHDNPSLFQRLFNSELRFLLKLEKAINALRRK